MVDRIEVTLSGVDDAACQSRLVFRWPPVAVGASARFATVAWHVWPAGTGLGDGAGGLVDDVDREPGLQRPVGDGSQGDRLVTHLRVAAQPEQQRQIFRGGNRKRELCVPPG
jgi:hypothetical protein